MADKRFFRSNGPFELAAIAAHAGAVLQHPERGAILIHDLAGLGQAGTEDISVFCDADHAAAFGSSRAAAIVTSESLGRLPHNGCILLFSDDPRLAFARIGTMFYPRATARDGCHPASQVAPEAILGADVEVGPGAVIEAGAIIGAASRIGANTVIGAGVEIGASSTIGPNCSISHALIGHHAVIASNTSIGGEGFGFVPTRCGMTKVGQLGRVVIGNHVDIGNNVCIDRGTLGDTVIGDGTALDNMIHVAHNVRIGKSCIFAAQSGIAGSAVIGDFVMAGGQTAIKDHVTIGNRVRLAGRSGVIGDIADGQTVGGFPAIPIRQWHRQTATLARQATRKSRRKKDD